MSYLEKKTQDYWKASSELARPIVETSEHRKFKDDLWDLRFRGPSYRLRNNSHKRLYEIGEHARMRPGPFSGDAA